jgi:hypothetical protein
VREHEEEEESREGDGATGSVHIRWPACVDPYEGLPVQSEFPCGPSDTIVLTGYAHHITRCIYDGHVNKLLFFFKLVNLI